MKHITTIEGLSLNEFDAWLRRDWSLYIFPPDEWHGHLLDAPAPVKMKTYPKTPIEAGYTFTQQIGADQVKQVGWVYVIKTTRIVIESEIQTPYTLNFAQWIQDRFGVTAKEEPDADTPTAYAGTKEKVVEAHRLRKQNLTWETIRKRNGADHKTYQRWCKVFTDEDPI